MNSEQKVTVLAAYKPFLHILTIYDSKNFESQEWRIRFRNTCQAIALLILYIGSVIAMYCDISFCFRNNFNVAHIALPFGIMINIIQLTIAYTSIRLKNYLVDRVMVYLETIVIHRMCYYWIFLST